jgi:hypothetical protein
MDNKKSVLILLGAFFLILGLYYRIYDPDKSNVSYEYLGLGTWISGLAYYTLFRKYKEMASLITGLIILHTGVILLLTRVSNPKVLGLLVFTAGIVVVLNSGFSDYMKKRSIKK